MRRYPHHVALAVLVAVLVLAAGFAWEADRTTQLTRSVASLQSSLAQTDTMLASLVETASSTAASTAANLAELARREQVTQAPSESDQLQNAVAHVTPAVVSIVESQEVPRLQVSYVNPFGSDPNFQGFGIQVPVYQQVGTTTKQVSAGTGFLVRGSGYIVTNRHVVPDTNATYTVLLSDGSQKTGTVIWRSSNQDLAVVKISGSGYPTVPLGDSSKLALGESVFAVGNALGQYNNSVSVGVISGLNRTITANDAQTGQAETLSGVLQTDAAINPGNSGGPLVDLAGNAVGINVATVQGSQNIGFSIPITQVRSALAQLGI